MKKIIVTLAIAVLYGCTGIETKITPEVSSQIFNQPYKVVGLQEISSIKNLKETGSIISDFSKSIKENGLVTEVYYPLRPDDKTETYFDTKFESSVNTHAGALSAKAFFTGFTLFLIEPFIWYDFDYEFTGEVSIFKDRKLIDKVSAKTDAKISAKWLSLHDVEQTQREGNYSDPMLKNHTND